MKKLSEVQRHALRFLRNVYPTDPYMPFRGEARTFEALARRGLATYLRVEDGNLQNGYVLTSEGRNLAR